VSQADPRPARLPLGLGAMPPDAAGTAEVRLAWIWLWLTVPLVLVLVRLGDLQLHKTAAYTDVFGRTAVIYEEIPAVDGRILAADGTVLADNEVLYDLLIHYRWLEQPSDAQWLRQQAWERLSRRQRRQSAVVSAEMDLARLRRDSLWTQLAQLTKRPLADLDRMALQTQQHVEELWTLVAERLARRDSERRGSDAPSTTDAARAEAATPLALGNLFGHGDADRPVGWQAWFLQLGGHAVAGGRVVWQRVLQELTTPPHRSRQEHLVIAEQEQYHTLLKNVSAEVAREIQSHPQRYPGVRIQTRNRRIYPQRDLAAHLVGSRTPLLPEDVAVANARATLHRQSAASTGDSGSQWDDASEQNRDRGNSPNEPQHANDHPSEATEQQYQVGDLYGRTGLEAQYEQQLKGVRGRRKSVINRRGEVLQTIVERPPQPGRDVVISIDLAAQRVAEQLLDDVVQPPPAAPRAPQTAVRSGLSDPLSLSDSISLQSPGLDVNTQEADPLGISVDLDESAHRAEIEPPTDDEPSAAHVPVGGCLVAIDVQTGAILAAAAAPRFDANRLVAVDRTDWQQLLMDRRRPLFSRATQMALPPGSVFKVITAAALLQTGTMTPEQTMDCRGYLDHPGQHRCLTFRHFGYGHGETNVSDALCRSCNVYFFQGARSLGPQRLVEWCQRFGIGSVTGLDLPGEASGYLPRPAQNEGRRRWFPGDTLGLAIGQSSLMVTPLQMARMMAAIANGGRLVSPHLVPPEHQLASRTAIETGRLTERPAVDERADQLDLQPENLAAIREGLDAVVNHPQGTAYKTVRLKELRIAGKTGTAEVGGGRPDHAWFAGYAPSDAPRIAFCVVLEEGGSGGKTAGPVARKFVQAIWEMGLLPSAGEQLAGP
jgi:penicillin-binding protein 2